MEKPQKKDYTFIASMVNPFGEQAPASQRDFDSLDANILLKLLKRNKIPLIYFDKKQRETYPDFFNTPQFKAQYEKEQARYTSLRQEWAKVREKFLAAGIESMLIKSVGCFPYKSSNLDVLIKQNKRAQAESILINMGYIQLHNVEEPYKTLFRTFAGGESNSVIHLHNKVAWINPFHDDELLWARYRKSSTDTLVDTPSAEDSLLILTAHWFYEDKEIKLSDIIEISSCLKNDKLDWEYMTNVAKKMGWLNGLYFALLVQSFVTKGLYGESLIPDERLKQMEKALPGWMRAYLTKKVYPRKIALPFKLPKLFGKGLHLLKTLHDTTTTPSRKVYELYRVIYAALFVVLFERLKLNIRYQPSMLISISGVDGAGKTTYAENLANMFIFCELKTRCIWSRVGSSDFLKPFSRLAKLIFSRKKEKAAATQANTPKEAGSGRRELFERSPILRVLGLGLLLIEMLWQYTFKVTLPLFLKKVVICDRYIYDTLADITTRYGTSPLSPEGKLFTGTLTALTPTPDIAYVLLIPLEDACSRREVGPEEQALVKEQIRLYREMTPVFNLRKIDTTSNTCITTISDKIINETLAHYYQKWPSKSKPA